MSHQAETDKNYQDTFDRLKICPKKQKGVLEEGARKIKVRVALFPSNEKSCF